MSYEGYDQRFCEKGHFSCEEDDYYYDYDNAPKCHCGASISWRNRVDDTNGNSVGKIQTCDLEKFITKPEIKEKCNLGHQHITRETVYKIPTEEETKLLRTYQEDDGTISYIVIQDVMTS